MLIYRDLFMINLSVFFKIYALLGFGGGILIGTIYSLIEIFKVNLFDGAVIFIGTPVADTIMMSVFFLLSLPFYFFALKRKPFNLHKIHIYEK